uniref:Variant surface glycoprotein 1125.1355 n=1 Tax=Trypanosoma brucei TaxID=5691 RepID=A0A1J0R6W8_9TRYP|nr:variant surface glycoprotein 1125.1355 [Trypanosoma brucei]
MKFLLLPLLALALAAAPVLANVAAGVNSAEFHAVCQLIQLTEGEPQLAAATAAYDQAIQKLQDMNMSVAEDSWQDMFKNQDGSNKPWTKRQEEAKQDPADWAEQWPKWTAAAGRVRAAKAKADQQDKKTILTVPDNLRQYARTRLEAALAKVTKLRKRSDELKEKAQKITAQTIKARLNAAMYGTTHGRGQYQVSGAGDNHKPQAAQCDDSAEAGGQSTLAHTLLCLCLSQTADKAAKPCFPEKQLTADWAAVETNIKTAFDEVRKFCQSGAGKPISAAPIRAAVDTALALVKVQDSHAYLGRFVATDCQGSSNRGSCVQYTNAATATHTKLSELNWVKEMLGAATDIDTTTAAQIENDQAAKAIEAEVEEANLIQQELEALHKIAQSAKPQLPATN